MTLATPHSRISEKAQVMRIHLIITISDAGLLMRQIASDHSSPCLHTLLEPTHTQLRFFRPNTDRSCCAGNFTDQERNRILGHSGTRIFEKHYQDNFIQRDLQSVVLLRPSQEALCRAAAQMNKNRDPSAPTGLTKEQLKAIGRMPRVLELRRERCDR